MAVCQVRLHTQRPSGPWGADCQQICSCITGPLCSELSSCESAACLEAFFGLAEVRGHGALLSLGNACLPLAENPEGRFDLRDAPWSQAET